MAFSQQACGLTGHIVFHGPREAVVGFFSSCGFKCPDRKGVPDFLQEVTSRNDQQVHQPEDPDIAAAAAAA